MIAHLPPQSAIIRCHEQREAVCTLDLHTPEDIGGVRFTALAEYTCRAQTYTLAIAECEAEDPTFDNVKMVMVIYHGRRR